MTSATLIDVVRANSDEFTGQLIDGIGESCPEWGLIPAKPVPGMTYTGNVIAEFPTGGFRGRGEGRTPSKGRVEPRVFNTGVYNPSWNGEHSILDAHSEGRSGFMSEQAQIHTIAAGKDIGRMFYYGDPSLKSANALKAFAGLKKLAGHKIDALGTSGDAVNTHTTVFAARIGAMGVEFVVGNDGQFTTSDPITRVEKDSNGKEFTLEHQEMLGYVGLKALSATAVGMIENITDKVDNAHLLTDDLASDLLSEFPEGFAPTHWFMHRRAGYLLAKSRQASSTTGLRVELPTELAGLPIVYTDSILRNESA